LQEGPFDDEIHETYYGSFIDKGYEALKYIFKLYKENPDNNYLPICKQNVLCEYFSANKVIDDKEIVTALIRINRKGDMSVVNYFKLNKGWVNDIKKDDNFNVKIRRYVKWQAR